MTTDPERLPGWKIQDLHRLRRRRRLQIISLLLGGGIVLYHLVSPDWWGLLDWSGSGYLQLEWSVRRSAIGAWHLEGDFLYAVGRGLRVYDARSGAIQRTATLDRHYVERTAGIISRDLVVTPTNLCWGWYNFRPETGIINCFDRATFQKKWQREISWDSKPGEPSIFLAPHNKSLFVATSNNGAENLFKLDSETGQVQWAKTVKPYILSLSLIVRDDFVTILSADTMDSYGYAVLRGFQAHTGKEIWSLRLPASWIYSQRTPLVIGNFAYITAPGYGDSPDHLFHIDITRGRLLWDARASRIDAPFFYDDHLLYFGGQRPAAYDPRVQRLLWQVDLDSWKEPLASVIAEGTADVKRGELYIGDMGKYLFLLSKDTGRIKTAVNVRKYFRGDFLQPAKAFLGDYGVKKLFFRDDRVYVGTVDGSLFVFRRTGE